jgi:hypothetical protein
MNMRPACASALLLAVLQAVVWAQQIINVTPLIRDDRVLVSFSLSNAFTDEVRTAMHSGLAITFVYDVDLKRSSTLWLDRTIGSATVAAGVRYDNLTREYHITRREDGRIERSEVTEHEEQARVWLTQFDKLPLFTSQGLEPNGEYYLRVRAHTSPRNASFVWPWQNTDVAGHAKFTFIR